MQRQVAAGSSATTSASSSSSVAAAAVQHMLAASQLHSSEPALLGGTGLPAPGNLELEELELQQQLAEQAAASEAAASAAWEANLRTQQAKEAELQRKLASSLSMAAAGMGTG